MFILNYSYSARSAVITFSLLKIEFYFSTLLFFCSDRFKISVNFYESVKVFIAKPNVSLGSLFIQMMTQIPYLQRQILLFVFYVCENPHILLYFGHISTNEKPDASFQVPLLHLTLYLIVLKILALVSLSRLDFCGRKSEIAYQLFVIFQTNFLSNYPYFLLPGCIFTFLNFSFFIIYFRLVKKSTVK